MVCFDASFMIALIRRDANAEKKLEEYVEAKPRSQQPRSEPANSFQRSLSFKEERKRPKVRKLLHHLEILQFSVEACERYGKLASELQLKGSPIGDPDTMIASIALTHGEPLLTSDKEHFGRVPGLMIETW